MNKFIKILFKHIVSILIAVSLLVTFAISFPLNLPSWESNIDWIFKQYFDKILVNTWSTTDWKVKKSQTLLNQDCGSWKVLQWFSSVWDKMCVDLISWTIVWAGQPWRQQYDINTEQSTNITWWTIWTSLPWALRASQAIVTKNRVYLLGWINGSDSVLSTVYTAPINADGILWTWTISSSLPWILARSQAIVTKDRVYLLGWDINNSGNTKSTVYTAPINADGTLWTWTTWTNLPWVLSHSQAIVTKNRVYLLGWYAGGSTSTVYTAPINSDGTLWTWTTWTSLPWAFSFAQAITTKNRVYLLAWWGRWLATSKVYTAPINSDGTLWEWTTETDLPWRLYRSTSIVTKNRVFLFGWGNTWTIATVYTAPINSDGTLWEWTTWTSLPWVYAESQAIVTSSRVYLLGGYRVDAISTVYTAPISGGLNDYSSYYNY